MPKKILKKFVPNVEKLKQYKSLKFLGARLHESDLWHLNRRSVSLAFAIGLLVSWIPTPGQMIIAAVVALYIRANLPISVSLVWVTNPITMPAMYYFAYVVGLWVSGESSPEVDFEFSLTNIFSSLGDIGVPFLLGCLFLGVISALLGYFGISLFWRHSTVKRWRLRKNKPPD